MLVSVSHKRLIVQVFVGPTPPFTVTLFYLQKKVVVRVVSQPRVLVRRSFRYQHLSFVMVVRVHLSEFTLPLVAFVLISEHMSLVLG